ncbi:MAG: hypothetical protein ACTSPU_15570 [Promethearchaeota archaeon]
MDYIGDVFNTFWVCINPNPLWNSLGRLTRCYLLHDIYELEPRNDIFNFFYADKVERENYYNLFNINKVNPGFTFCI